MNAIGSGKVPFQLWEEVVASAYTVIFESEPNISFERFVKRCAKAFCGDRDEPLSSELIPNAVPKNDWYRTQKREAVAALLERQEWDAVRWSKELAKHIKERKEVYADVKAHEDSLRRAYSEMLEQVNRWQPPITYRALKQFMRDQLSNALETDCNGTEYHKRCIEKYESMSPEDYRKAELSRLKEDMAHYDAEDKKQTARAERENEWVRQLLENLATEANDMICCCGSELDGSHDHQTCGPPIPRNA